MEFKGGTSCEKAMEEVFPFYLYFIFLVVAFLLWLFGIVCINYVCFKLLMWNFNVVRYQRHGNDKLSYKNLVLSPM